MRYILCFRYPQPQCDCDEGDSQQTSFHSLHTLHGSSCQSGEAALHTRDIVRQPVVSKLADGNFLELYFCHCRPITDDGEDHQENMAPQLRMLRSITRGQDRYQRIGIFGQWVCLHSFNIPCVGFTRLVFISYNLSRYRGCTWKWVSFSLNHMPLGPLKL